MNFEIVMRSKKIYNCVLEMPFFFCLRWNEKEIKHFKMVHTMTTTIAIFPVSHRTLVRSSFSYIFFFPFLLFFTIHLSFFPFIGTKCVALVAFSFSLCLYFNWQKRSNLAFVCLRLCVCECVCVSIVPVERNRQTDNNCVRASVCYQERYYHCARKKIALFRPSFSFIFLCASVRCFCGFCRYRRNETNTLSRLE